MFIQVSAAPGPDGGFPGGTATRSSAHSSGWIGGTSPLPQGLLTAAVGDLDLIARLSRHGHQVHLPNWTCALCSISWPCEPAQADLLLDLGWSKTAILAAVLMERAVKDLVEHSPRELWERFLQWTQPPEELRQGFLEQFVRR